MPDDVDALTPQSKWVSFQCQADPGSEVFVGGTFNGWKPSRFDRLQDKRNDGTYTAQVKLLPGRHAYDFLVDGVWLSHPTPAHVNPKVMDVA